jgi:predicted dehydrogenase
MEGDMPSPLDGPGQRLRAVVVGLGQAGSRFDEEPGRTAIWSHVGAYLHLAARFELCGGADVAPASLAAFRARCPDLPACETVDELIRLRPQVASVCTPADSHAAVVSRLLACPDLRLIWCEKPLALELAEARRLVEACRARNVLLMTSFNRHWLPLWRRVRAMIDEGAVGAVRSLRVAMPNRFYSVGSHAVDLALMLGGPVDEIAALELPALTEGEEPAVTAVLRHRSGAAGIVQVTGFKPQLIVEAEVIGDDGRLWAREDSGRIVIERFAASPRYAGYRQLDRTTEETAESLDTFSPFVAMAENAADAVTCGVPLACDGDHALEVQRVLDLMTQATRRV